MKEEKSLLNAVIIVIVLAVCSLTINGCFFFSSAAEIEYPVAMEGDYYGDYYVYLDYPPVYGVGIYFIFGRYYYYDGYRYWRHGRYLWRYYTVWIWDGIPYYWYGGHYVRIYQINYYSYNVRMKQWISKPLPHSTTHFVGYPVPPKKHYEAYPPKSHPKVQAIPKSASIPPKYDHKAYPPKKVGSGPGVPKPPQNKVKNAGISPGIASFKPAKPKLNYPAVGKPKISTVPLYKHQPGTRKFTSPKLTKPSNPYVPKYSKSITKSPHKYKFAMSAKPYKIHKPYTKPYTSKNLRIKPQSCYIQSYHPCKNTTK